MDRSSRKPSRMTLLPSNPLIGRIKGDHATVIKLLSKEPWRSRKALILLGFLVFVLLSDKLIGDIVILLYHTGQGDDFGPLQPSFNKNLHVDRCTSGKRSRAVLLLRGNNRRLSPCTSPSSAVDASALLQSARDTDSSV